MTGAGPLAYDNKTKQIFVAAGGGVQVISTVTDDVVAQISIPNGPMTAGVMTYASGQGELFVTWNNHPGNLTIINTTTDTFVTTIPMSNWYGSDTCFDSGRGIGTSGITYDNESGEVWLAVTCGIAVISGATNSLVTTISPSFGGGGGDPEGAVILAYDSGVNEVYAAANNGAVFSGSSFAQIGQFGFPEYPKGCSFCTGQGVQSIQDGMAYNAAMSELFVGYGVPVGLEPNVSFEAVIPDGTPSGGVTTSISVGYLPEGIVYDDVAGIMLLVNDGSNNVTAIHDTTNQVTVPFTLNSVANDVTFDAQGNELFVTTQAGVSIIPLAPSATLTPSRPGTDTSTTVSFNSTVQDVRGGPYTYRYTVSNVSAGCALANSPELNCTPTRPGVFNVSVDVIDAVGLSAVATSPTVNVDPALLARLTVSNSTPLLGQTVAFVANASGGLAPYSYNYTGFPPGCVSEDKAAIGCLPTQADYYNITVHVTDHNGVTNSSTVAIHVIFDFNVVVPTTTSAGSPFTISVNTNETFSGGSAFVPAGGFGAFTYNYTGLPPGCTSQDAASITCTPTQVGTYHITVNVHDQVGDHQTHTVVVNVVPAKSTTGILGFSGDTGYFVIGGVVAAAAALFAVFAIRSRRSKRDDHLDATAAKSPPEPQNPPP